MTAKATVRIRAAMRARDDSNVPLTVPAGATVTPAALTGDGLYWFWWRGEHCHTAAVEAQAALSGHRRGYEWSPGVNAWQKVLPA